ncbi:MAG: tetratricopeptide repeat protein [Nodosilinea sp.]
MYDLVSAALKAQQLSQAAQMLQQWRQKSPQDPWLQLALGQYWETRGELEKAQLYYTRLLQTATNTNVLGQAREGVQRVSDRLAQRREHDLTAAKNRPGAAGAAVLILQPVVGESRLTGAAGLAKVLHIDPYTARMRLPSQHWRLLRTGTAGELQYLCEQLKIQQVPAFWARIEHIKQIPVFRVQAIQAFAAQITLVCQNSVGQRGSLAFHGADVSQWIVGQLPIYESVVDLDPRGKLKRRETTQDYAEVIDLHLKGRGCILRLCDRTYRYRESATPATIEAESPQAGAALVATTAWKALKAYFQGAIGLPPKTDFTGFGAGALDLMELLPFFEPHIDLARELPSPWDSAFHLYSGLRFLADSPKA